MSWGIEFKADIYLIRQSYSSLYEVEEAIEDLKEEIESEKESILMYAASTPKDIITEAGYDIVHDIKSSVKDCLDTIEENRRKICELTYYVEYLKEKENDKESSNS